MDINKIRVPADIPLIFYVFFLLSYYKILIKLKPAMKIIDSFGTDANKKTPVIPSEISEQKLYKLWYVCHILQENIFRDTKPCLSRAILLFKWCRTNGLRAKIIFGVKKKTNRLEGHSWLVFNGKPVNENMEYLQNFKIMTEKDSLESYTS